MLTRTRTRKRTSTVSALTQQNVENDSSKPKAKRGKKPKALVPKLEPEAAQEPELVTNDENNSLFYGYEDEMTYLEQRITTLFRQNKANSVIICGDTGIGKNYLVDACLSKYPVVRNEPDPSYGHLNVVLFEFDGNLHGKNDLATLRIIGRRLNLLLEKARQVTVEEEGDEELDDSDMFNKVANSIPMIVAQFRFLIEHSANFRCIIILDNFEVFSYRQQYLLYNLFDLIQQGQAVLIIGLTRRIDCIQLLTSRVQSRLNRRMIHLVSPFKTLDAFSRFCKDYCIHLGVNVTLPATELDKAYALNRNFDELKRFVQQYSFIPFQPEDGVNKTKSSSAIVLHGDPKIVQLTNLTRNELFLLIIASKQLRNLNEETFTCQQMHEWSTKVTHLKSLRFEQVIKCIYKMLELDLLIVAKETRSQSSKTCQLYISPYTSLMLNISDFQLKETMTSLGNNFPEYMKQLLR